MGSTSDIHWLKILRRFWRDLRDRSERTTPAYSFIRQFPGKTGDMLRVRHLAPRMKKAGTDLRIQAGSRFRSIENIEVGNRVIIGFDNFLQAKGGLKLGNNVVLAPGVKIWTINHNTSDPDIPMQGQGHTDAPVVIEDDVFVASNAFILPGTTLSRGCIVSAGSVVNGKFYRPFSILGGNPARVIGYRGGRTPKAEENSRADDGRGSVSVESILPQPSAI